MNKIDILKIAEALFRDYSLHMVLPLLWCSRILAKWDSRIKLSEEKTNAKLSLLNSKVGTHEERIDDHESRIRENEGRLISLTSKQKES